MTRQDLVWEWGLAREAPPGAKPKVAKRYSTHLVVVDLDDIPSVQKTVKPPKERRTVFPNTDAIKDNIRSIKDKRKAYDVSMYYHKKGWARNLATNSYFEYTTLALIAINAIYMAVDTDWNKSPPGEVLLGFVLAEHFFCAYFPFEWIVRFCAFKNKCDGRKDAWFVFDTVLVIMMVFETWVLLIVSAISGGGAEVPIPMHLLRIFRLLRLSRLVRMMRNFPELMILIKGMLLAMQSCVWVMLLQFIIICVCNTILSALRRCRGSRILFQEHSTFYVVSFYLCNVSGQSCRLHGRN